MKPLEDPPAMPFYCSDWLTGEKTGEMTPEQKGGFIDLLAKAWKSTPPCTLPDDDAILAKHSGLGPARWKRAGGLIRSCFQPVPEHPGRIRNRKQWEVWEHLRKLRDKRSGAGTKGGQRSGEQRSKDQANRQANKEANYQANREAKPNPSSSSSSSSSYPENSRFYTEQNQEEEEKSGEPQSDSPQAVEPPVVVLPLVKRQGEYGITEAQVIEMQQLYPGINVPQVLRNMRGWCLSNPENRKTRAGVMRFIHRWLAKAQNEARPNGSGLPGGSGAGKTDRLMEKNAIAVAEFLEEQACKTTN